jgi:hypothetical protein
MALNGRPVSVTDAHAVAGDQRFALRAAGCGLATPAPRAPRARPRDALRGGGGARRDGAGEAGEAGAGGAYPRGHEAFLAILQLFWAVRDGDARAAAAALASGAPPAVPCVPSEFPERRPLAAGRGAGGRAGAGAVAWPRHGYDGVVGDTALHLAARYRDEAVVRALLHAGADPRARNADEELAEDCAGKRVAPAAWAGAARGARRGGRGGRGRGADSERDSSSEGAAGSEWSDSEEEEAGGRGGDVVAIRTLLVTRRAALVEAEAELAAARAASEQARLVSRRMVLTPCVEEAELAAGAGAGDRPAAGVAALAHEAIASNDAGLSAGRLAGRSAPARRARRPPRSARRVC